MSQPELDRLVDEITRRVKDRLGPTSDGTPSCAKPGTKTCDDCRGCHVQRPDDVRNIVQLGAARVAAGAGHPAPASDLAPLIDHTLLKADATRDELKKLCDEARRYGFATVCVNAVNVRYCAALLEGSSTKAIAVVGFPLGARRPRPRPSRRARRCATAPARSTW